jgi:hypothetical protein
MLHFKKVLVTFAATAALLASAGPAVASSDSAPAPAKPAAASTDSCLLLCYVIVGDVVSYNNVPVSVAANICNVSVPVLSAFALLQTAACAITPTQTGIITRVL